MRKAWIVLASLILFAGSLSADTIETIFFRQIMSTANEAPPVEGVEASARAIIAAHVRRNDAGTVVSGVVDFDIDYNFAEAVTVIGLHIRNGPAGVVAPVVIGTDLSGTNTAAAQGRGNIFRQVKVESGAALTALIGLLENPSNFYVNLHTTTFPDGLIRAQLAPAEPLFLRALLSPANEVPPIVGLDASGSGSAFILANRNEQGVVTSGTMQYDVSYRFPSPVTFTGLHIHPAAAGENGPAVLASSLSRTDPDAIDVTQGTLRRRFEVSSGAPLDALRLLFSNPTGAYLNIHTTVNTGGAMRGQMASGGVLSMQVPMSPAQEVPPIAGLEASGLAQVSFHQIRNTAGELTSATVILDVNYRFPGSVEFVALHIHSAAAGQNGPVVIDSGITDSNSVRDAGGVGNLFRIMDVGPSNPEALAALRSLLTTPGPFYLNLCTTVNPDGAIRGQLQQGALPAPAISSGGIVNATNAARVAPASPGSLISIYGSNLTRFTVSGTGIVAGLLPTTRAGTQVQIGTTGIPLLFVSPNQINAQVPFELPPGTYPVTVTNGISETSAGMTSSAQSLTVTSFSPAIFAVVKNSDFLRTTASNPVRAGDELAVFATGLGAVTPALASGLRARASPLSTTVTAPIVTIGGVPATVVSPTPVLAPGFVGVYQANVRVPAGAPAGSQPLVLTVGGSASNAVSVNVQ